MPSEIQLIRRIQLDADEGVLFESVALKATKPVAKVISNFARSWTIEMDAFSGSDGDIFLASCYCC